SRVLGAPSEVLRLDNFLIYWVFYTTKANFLQFDLDKYKRFWRFYTISKARQSKMSESRAVKVAILDKFRQILVVLYQRRSKKMSENAERPARSGRG
ncbi:MAG: hypothetical protein IKI42_03930, partial [Clostridia bacterium]|nr:hypothetical protein [Clostridia bacterium]